MRFQFIDGYEFEADSAEGICKALWDSMKFDWYKDLNEWMMANAKVMKNGLGIKLRTDSIQHHVDDMLKHGIVKPL